jgi:hypothetical protein
VVRPDEGGAVAGVAVSAADAPDEARAVSGVDCAAGGRALSAGELALLALSRTLPPPRDLRVLRAIGEQLALRLPFDVRLSFALDAIVELQAREAGRPCRP